jgi:DNA polymerase
MIQAQIDPTFTSWRTTARAALEAEIDPNELLWTDESASVLPMFAQPLDTRELTAKPTFTVPPEFLSLAKTVCYHRDETRWSLLYRLLFRLTHDEPRLLEIEIDDDVHRLCEMEKSVRRDLHKMHAFVRFRRIDRPNGEQHFIAFHRPDHLIIPAAAPWFAKRFPTLRWTILTPDDSAAWDLQKLHYAPGVPASPVQADDVEDLWKTYYANIFNPARIKVRAMKKEMAVRHWPTLPETQLIDDLLRQAPARVEKMIRATAPALSNTPPAATSAAQFIPQTRELPVLQQAARACKGCDLYCHATQTVFGQGPANASAMFIGEQPGDHEDRAGKPFIGPAGQLLDEAFTQVGINRENCYVTNAVKHFKFIPRGKRRIHSKPSPREVAACKPWLLAEIEIIKPPMIIALGATAAQALMGPQFRITENHGQIFTTTPFAPWFMATIHPSALLRIPDPALRAKSHAQFLEDLRAAANRLNAITSAPD